jgi:lipid-A-disaccharide synthase
MSNEARGAGASGPLKIALVAGEPSGDILGADLMAALERRHDGPVRFSGLGGDRMVAAGLETAFPMAEVAVMGPLAILERLPHLLRRIADATRAVLAADPDLLVIIDAPELTHRIARRVRRRRPALPIIDYVSPSVWAWRPGRAAKMRSYVDHVLALLPFEPDVHRRLGGPECTYVGHPSIERYGEVTAADDQELARRLGLDRASVPLVVLPGSRPSEVDRLMQPFGEAVGLLAAQVGPLAVLLPTLPHVRPQVEAALAGWPVRPHILTGDADKWAAFKLARGALAASGTVTLELALAGTPMVVAYRVDGIARMLRPLVKTPHFALANLIVGERAFPELVQEDCTAAKLASALTAILADGPTRANQLARLARIPPLLLAAGPSPSEAAAAVVLDHAPRAGAGMDGTRRTPQAPEPGSAAWRET